MSGMLAKPALGREPAAGVVLGLMNSYPALAALAGLVTIAGAVTVSRVRSVS